MKKYVVYELFQHPTLDETGFEKRAEFSSRDEASMYAESLQLDNLVVKEEYDMTLCDTDNLEDTWSGFYPYYPYSSGE